VLYPPSLSAPYNAPHFVVTSNATMKIHFGAFEGLHGSIATTGGVDAFQYPLSKYKGKIMRKYQVQ
jgi:hypothetical protein